MGWLEGAGYILSENKTWLERNIVHILLLETEIQERVMPHCLCVRGYYWCLLMVEKCSSYGTALQLFEIVIWGKNFIGKENGCHLALR
jgi:hypothetical protein